MKQNKRSKRMQVDLEGSDESRELQGNSSKLA